MKKQQNNFEFRKWGNGSKVYGVSFNRWDNNSKMFKTLDLGQVKQEDGKWIGEYYGEIAFAGKSRKEVAEKLLNYVLEVK